MDEYINKQLAVEELENLRQQYEIHDDCDELVARKCKNAVLELPAADVAQEHLDAALVDMMAGRQLLIPFAERYPELKKIKY